MLKMMNISLMRWTAYLMSKENMRVEFHNAVKTAFMTKKPLVIVEGKDDLGIYINLINGKSSKYNVKPIEYFKGCDSGCSAIEKKITYINQKYEEGHSVYKYFKGIVDSDAKPFRNEIDERAGILYLNSYSFENSFVTDKSIIYIIQLLTSITHEESTRSLSDKMMELINTQLLEFYYITLEALKNAVVENYDSLLGFSDGYERFLYDKTKSDLLERKRKELDLFAHKYALSDKCIMDMKSYCKGKWHLSFFLKSILNFMSELHLACGNELVQCPLCEIGEKEKCLYKKKVDMNVGQLINTVKNDIENSDLEYVKVELALLG
jgi:hypothetical protein